MNVHLVDGTYELFRAYYGVPERKGASGQEVGAAYGLARTLIALLRNPAVTHVGVAFDHVIESFRNDLFDGYKTGDGIDPLLSGQFELAERVTRALGIVTWPMVEFEADDMLAAAAARFREAEGVEQVFLCSPDKDFAQCVRGQRVVLWDRRRELVIDEEGVHNKWGVAPGSIPDWLALVGDSADGIPGVPKWGAKSTAAVLSRYGSISAIPVDAADWDIKVRGAKGLSASLEEHREAAALYRVLATLREDVPFQGDLEALRWTGPDAGALDAVADELAAPELISRVAALTS
ncbi:MAG: 5'-3' exonuclease [Planctomycetota bacterium]|jgi:5'-3' exonuclease